MSRYVRFAGGQSRTSNLNTQWEYIYSCSNWTESLGSVACFEIPFKDYNAIKTVFIGSLVCSTTNRYCIDGYQCYRYENICTAANASYIYLGGGIAACYASTEEIIFYPSCGSLINFCSQFFGSQTSYLCRSHYGSGFNPEQCPWNWNCVEFIRVCGSTLQEVLPHPDINASFHVFGQSK